MKSICFAGALAAALTLGAGVALAQTGPHIGDGKNSVTPPNPYNSGGAAAHVGDGSNSGTVPDQYSIANGAAAQDARKHYVAGRTESEAPPPGMARDEQTTPQKTDK